MYTYIHIRKLVTMWRIKSQWRSFVYYGEYSDKCICTYVKQRTRLPGWFLTRKIQILFARVPVLQQEFRRSSSNPRTMEYSVKRTTHFNTRRNTLCATKSQRMHHEQTDSYHGLFIIRKSALQAALAQPAQHYRLPPLYESTPFVPTFLPYIFVLFITVSKKYGTRSLHVKFNTYS